VGVSTKKNEKLEKELAEAREAVQPNLLLRTLEPESVVFHVGPTNSGKTHDALDALAGAEQGVYAAPLRMLAGEAFERLSERLGEDRIGLITGEERIRDNAPILCCTAEMAPMSGELLVLDEVHWASDLERGWAWTRLLLGANYRHIHIAGPPDALPLVRRAFPDATVIFHERLSPLTVEKKPIALNQVPERAVVVAFSRKSVYHIAGLLQQAGRHPAVLYGAMPPGARREEISRFVNGSADVIVATDVIGHGINLPVSAVVFAETSKFDGVVRRNLLAWEVAQIAGRAGRFGFDTSGTVMALKGISGLDVSIHVVLSGIEPTVKVEDGVYGFHKVKYGRLAPNLADLGATKASQLPVRLKVWSEVAENVVKQVGWVKKANVSNLRQRLDVIDSAVGLETLDVEAAWRLARSPLDMSDVIDVSLLKAFARALVTEDDLKYLMPKNMSGSLEELEQAGHWAAGLRWFALAFPGAGGVTHDEAVKFEAAVTKAIVSKLDSTIKNGVARCEECGRQCAPWSRWCDSCYFQRSVYSYDYDDYDYEYEVQKVIKQDENWIKREIKREQHMKTWDDMIKEAWGNETVIPRPSNFPRPIWLMVVQRLVAEVAPEKRNDVVEKLTLAFRNCPLHEHDDFFVQIFEMDFWKEAIEVGGRGGGSRSADVAPTTLEALG
jgi:ATP-dependent RNA helicase SUPV3L1/SUV3